MISKYKHKTYYLLKVFICSYMQPYAREFYHKVHITGHKMKNFTFGFRKK